MVKFAHLRADPAVVGVQVRVLRHIEAAAPGLPDGPLRGRVVHALSYLDGRLLRSVTTDPPLRRAMGATLAGLGRALRGFDDPLVRRPLLWDLAQLPQLRPLAAERPPGPRTDLLGPGLDLVAGYHAVTPLTAAELGLLPDLILGRIVARIIISEWRAERFPDNRGYVLRNTPRAWEHLDRLLSIPREEIAARIQEATRA